jgi:ribosome-binding factor A
MSWSLTPLATLRLGCEVIMADGRRPLRVAEDIRNALTVTMGKEFADPRLMGTVITRVEVSPDLSVARIFVRLLQDPTPRVIKEVLRALSHASGRFRRAIAQALRTKRVPELRFEYDQAHDDRARVDALLHEIRQDEQARQEAPTPDESKER